MATDDRFEILKAKIRLASLLGTQKPGTLTRHELQQLEDLADDPDVKATITRLADAHPPCAYRYGG
jgi:hypothetical protein